MARMTVGLVNQSDTVKDERVQQVADALTIQVRRDLQPIWGVDADIVSLGRIATVPSGISPVFVVDQTPNGFSGIHTITQNVPWAMVSTKRDWILAASHEIIELLVDPTGEKTVSAPGLALTDGVLTQTDETFDYLLEACDPIEDKDHAYPIGDVLVSDFYTPEFFDAAVRPGARYSHNGALSRPREVGRNGYLSWHDPVTRKLRQLRNFDGYGIVDLPDHAATSLADQQHETVRGFVDRHTHTPRTHPERFRR